MSELSRKTLKMLQNILGSVSICSGTVAFFAKFALTNNGYGKFIDYNYYCNNFEFAVNFPNIYWFSCFTFIGFAILMILLEVAGRIFTSSV